MLPSRKRSLIWLHFSEIEQGKRARCNICRSCYNFTNNSISNLTRHLKLKHPTISVRSNELNDNINLSESYEIEQLKSETNIPISNNDLRQVSSNSSSVLLTSSQLNQTVPTLVSFRTNFSLQKTNIHNYFRSKRPVLINLAKSLHNQLLIFIAKGYHPLLIVEDNEFRKFLEMLCPGYTLPSRKLLVESLLLQ